MRRILAVVVALTSVLLACGACDDDPKPAHPSWTTWAKQHPLPGARVQSASHSDQGWTIRAGLTETPSEKSVAAALDNLCDFAQAAAQAPDVELQIGTDSIESINRCQDRSALVALWSDLHDLPGVGSVRQLRDVEVTLGSDDADAMLAVFRTAARHADAIASIQVTGPFTRLDADPDSNPAAALRKADRARAVIGPLLRGIEVDADTVTASVAGPRAALPALRRKLPGVEVDSTLTVLPDRASRTQVGLLEDLSLRHDVTKIDYDGSRLTVTTFGDAVSVADQLADPRLRSLRPLAIALPGSFAHSECTVTLRFPDDGHLAAAMRRCLQARSN